MDKYATIINKLFFIATICIKDSLLHFQIDLLIRTIIQLYSTYNNDRIPLTNYYKISISVVILYIYLFHINNFCKIYYIR